MTDNKVINELKILALEMINHAGSGHSGSVLSCGDALYTLYTKHLLTDGSKHMLRDRFVFSNGHVCAIQYALFAGLGIIDFDEIKSFRKYGALLAGHPEIQVAGVDANTGPLGQGLANAVGMAIAETIMEKRFGASHYTYCMVGDGCLEEGVGLESLSVAGLYKLNKLIVLYDKNNVTLDGHLTLSSHDDMTMKFRAMNFDVIECDGHDMVEIDNAIIKAKKSKEKPTVIILNTIMAKDTVLEGSCLSHGKVFDDDEINRLKKLYKINNKKLSISEEAKLFLNNKKIKIISKFNEKIAKFNEKLNKNKILLENYNNFINNNFKSNILLDSKNQSTRDANNIVLTEIAKTRENLVVLSADLSNSTKVKINDGGVYSAENRLGKNIAIGIREHAMGAIANGMALHGGLVPVVSTFLSFSNYMLPPIRMAGIMNLPVIFTFSHSSSYDAGDGITHVPVEQIDQIRLMPNITVVRPHDMAEIAQSYNSFFIDKNPMCLCVSKASSNFIGKKKDMDKGAYFVTHDDAKINIMASGSEVDIAMAVKDVLAKQNIIANVISVPSIEIFERQSEKYKATMLDKPLFVIETSTCIKYLKYTREEYIFNIQDYGVSGDSESIKSHFGYNANTIAKTIIKKLK
ncbi:MAG: hypothetical protein E7351_03695 [Clostridiales bacterium]|nr:hypothetical protein [Clostridiales bacterium]